MPPLCRQHVGQQTCFEAPLLVQHLFFKAQFVLIKMGLPLLAADLGFLLNGQFDQLNSV